MCLLWHFMAWSPSLSHKTLLYGKAMKCGNKQTRSSGFISQWFLGKATNSCKVPVQFWNVIKAIVTFHCSRHIFCVYKYTLRPGGGIDLQIIFPLILWSIFNYCISTCVYGVFVFVTVCFIISVQDPSKAQNIPKHWRIRAHFCTPLTCN